MLAGACPAFAKPASVPVAATPIGSPGDWIGSGDYPAAALRFDMTGVTVFRLGVDTDGKPGRCEIVESSGFDVLDRATCQRLMARARFTPARDRAGGPTEGAYSNRVRWALPDSRRIPDSERFFSMLLSIDQTGKVTSCRIVFHVPAEAAQSAERVQAAEYECKRTLNAQSLAAGLEMRGNFQGPSADVEIQMAIVFTPALRARVLSPKPGYEQRALNIHRFTVTRDGKLARCSYAEQRGSDLFAADVCIQASRDIFDPPFSAFDKDGTASGWRISRVLLKTGQ
ncbi:MAG: energy transducer TonB [Novosphingobium sp.]|nr:energy transducer TonB [Novosphingobium sp.]